jgi:hypothetical protein
MHALVQSDDDTTTSPLTTTSVNTSHRRQAAAYPASTKRRQMLTGGLGPMTGADPNTPMRNSNNAAAANLENLPAMINGVMGHDPSAQLEYTTYFRRLLSIEKNPPIQQVIASGVVPRFVEFLNRDDNPPLQFEAAWALT